MYVHLLDVSVSNYKNDGIETVSKLHFPLVTLVPSPLASVRQGGGAAEKSDDDYNYLTNN